MQHTCGILFYRRKNELLEVIIVHPSGSYNRHSPWSIPKGLPNAGESFEQAARRECREEIGIDCTSSLLVLGSNIYPRGGKTMWCFATDGSPYTPQCASWEIDGAEWCEIEEARSKLHQVHHVFLDRLKASI